jgi:hypothetical protein
MLISASSWIGCLGGVPVHGAVIGFTMARKQSAQYRLSSLSTLQFVSEAHHALTQIRSLQFTVTPEGIGTETFRNSPLSGMSVGGLWPINALVANTLALTTTWSPKQPNSFPLTNMCVGVNDVPGGKTLPWNENEIEENSQHFSGYTPSTLQLVSALHHALMVIKSILQFTFEVNCSKVTTKRPKDGSTGVDSREAVILVVTNTVSPQENILLALTLPITRNCVGLVCPGGTIPLTCSISMQGTV